MASIAPWLPVLREFLPQTMLLGGKAAELYYFSVLEKPAPPFPARETLFGSETKGKNSQSFHDHLIRQGFQRRSLSSFPGYDSRTGYYREDLGLLEFRRMGSASQGAATRGLSAIADPRLKLLLEDPHEVEVRYLGESYPVRIPQVGRFILAGGLGIKAGKKAPAEELYRASQNWTLLLYLLARQPELEEEALNDLVEVRPPALLREFRQNLKDNGPGTVLWEGAQKFHLDLFPGVRGVQLTSWYWKFLQKLSRVLEEQKIGN